MSSKGEINVSLHRRQTDAFDSVATEILYGGAAGGGKSHLMRVAAITWCTSIPGLQVYLFRRIYDDLIKNHVEGPKGFRAMLAPWVAAGFVRIVDDEIRFWNGSKIYLCHCQYEKDVYKYQGAEIHVLLIDELTHWTQEMYRFLRNRVRMVGLIVPPELQGKFPRILCGANPGNIGHQFVKTTFIDNVTPMAVRKMDPSEGGMLRQYIPARLDDNPSMAKDDPGYEDRLSGLGSPSLVAAMRDGDWNVVEGAFFDNWSTKRHVIRPFKIPDHWTRIRSGDWGSAKPFSIGWWAIASEPSVVDGVTIPVGCMVRYREWYGAKSPNVGLKMVAEDVGKGIRALETGDKIHDAVMDPSAFSEDGGPSIKTRLGVFFRPADNKRLPGWDQMRSRLKGDNDGNPMLVVFSTCTDFIRTVPVLQHDKNRPEDLDSDMEDHAADEARYGCMSRPWTAPQINNNLANPPDLKVWRPANHGQSWKTA